MTIQMLRQWNGLPQFSIQNLAPAEEARLIAAGLARDFVIDMDGNSAVLTQQQVRATQALVSSPLKNLLKPKTRAVSIFAPRPGTFTTSASGTTFGTTKAAARRFDAFQVVLHNAGATAINIDACTVAMCSGANTASKLMGGGQAIVQVTFDGGSATSNIPAAATNRRVYKVSDIIDVANVEAVDRDDGGTLHLINCRHYTSQASTSISVIGDVANGDDFTAWATSPNGRIWVSRQMSGNQANTAGASWSTTNISQTTIAGFIFYCQGRVVTVGEIGDSVRFGFGASPSGSGLASLIANEYQGRGGAAVEVVNVARSGATTDQYKFGIADLAAAGLMPDVMLLGTGTINDFSGTLAAGNVRKWRRWLSIQMAQCYDNDCLPVPVTMAPTTFAVEAMGASDALRVAHNADVLSWRSRDQPVIDLAGALGGTPGSGGQIEPASAVVPDGAHPNDAGYALALSDIRTQLGPVFVGA